MHEVEIEFRVFRITPGEKHNMKNRIEDYTEEEFLTFIENIFYSKAPTEKIGEQWMAHFEKISEHPRKSDVCVFPLEGEEDSPEGILKRVKEWRAANGKPGFKAN